MGRRVLAVLLLSVLGHGALVAGARLRPASHVALHVEVAVPFADRIRGPVRDALSKARVRRERLELLGKARRALRDGTLGLGDFLLRANAIDAEERAQTLDADAARALYGQRVEALREALAREDAREALPEVFADLRYYGRPGGLMADALLDRGGSCEQLAHLLAAAAYDARPRRDLRAHGARQDEVALRYYGGPMDAGASHLTVVVGVPGAEFDVLAGAPSIRAGVRFAATDLVEAYARTHGLSPPLGPAARARPAGGQGSTPAATADSRAPAADRPSLTAGYPPNEDRFPGSVPLYAARGVAAADPSDDDARPGDRPEAPAEFAKKHARSCSLFLRLGMLDPPAVELLPDPTRPAGGPSPRIELRRTAAPSELERKAALLRAAEDLAANAASDEADRLMALACLAALGDDVAVDFTLAGERALALAAREKAKVAAEEGARAVVTALGAGNAGRAIRGALAERFAGQTWLLLVLGGGDRLVETLVRAASRDDWGQVNALAGMVVSRATRERALALLATIARREQIDVMHEIFRADDRLRPWASSTSIDDLDPPTQGSGATRGGAPAPASTGEFRRAYRVFRGLAWRLWEGQRPPGETLTALSAEVAAAGLDTEWEALLLEYYSRNLLGLSQRKVDGLALVRELERAVRRNGHPSLGSLRRRLEELEASGRVDAETLSDAWRLR